MSISSPARQRPPGPGSEAGTSPSTGRRALVAVVVLGALVAVATWDPLFGAFATLVAAVEPVFASHPVVGALLFVVLSAVSALLAFFSTGALVPVALGVWGPVGTGLLLWLGWTLGGIGTYTVGRWIGRPVAVRLNRAEEADRLLARIPHDAPIWLIAILQIALQSELSGLVLGMARYPFGRYLTALLLAEVVFAGLTVTAAMGLVERHTGVLVGAGAVLAVVAVGAFSLLRTRLPQP